MSESERFPLDGASDSEILRRADSLVNEAHTILFRHPCEEQRAGRVACTRREEDRLSRDPDGTRRDPDRMCPECAAYEYLGRAHDLLCSASVNARTREKEK